MVPPHFMLSVLKASYKPMAHLGTVREGKENPKTQCCSLDQQIWSLTPAQTSHQHKLISSTWEYLQTPPEKHSKEINPKEPGLRQATSHSPPLPTAPPASV